MAILGLKWGILGHFQDLEKFHSHSLTYPQVTPRCARVAGPSGRTQGWGGLPPPPGPPERRL